jgi:uncharacterized protein YidB (DUF937 family)
MSFLGDLAKKAFDGLASGKPGVGSQDSVSALLPSLAGLLNQVGGIDGLVAKFKAAGLGDKIAGWISTGPNPPTTPEEVKAALGPHLEEIAQATGQDVHSAASGLAALLPGLIDKLTPNGQAPDRDQLSNELHSLLRGGLGKILG